MNISTRTLNRLLWGGALVLAVLPVMGQGGQEACRGGRACCDNVCGNLPGLTEAQKTAITALETKTRPIMEERRKAAQEAHEALRQAEAKSPTDRATLKGLFDKESQARFAMLEARQSFRQEMEKLLTPEQKAQWEKRRGDGLGMDSKRGGGMERGMGMRGNMGMRGGMGMGQGEGSCPMGPH